MANGWKWIVLLLTVAAPMLPVCVEAQEEPQEVQRLDEVVVTATKYETSIKDVPASITVIDEEELTAQNLPNADIGDALRYVPGITVRRAYAPFPAYVNIRGAGSDSTVYLVNGIPTDWQISQAIPVEMVQRVEVIRGPASALYGANASGGVINIILKEGGGENTAELKAGGGSFGRIRGAGSAEGGLKDFRYALAGYYEEADGANVVHNNVSPGVHMIDDCDYDKGGGAVSAGYKVSDLSDVHMFYNYFTNNYTRGRPNVGGDWDYNLAGLIYDHTFGEKLKFRAYAAFRDDDYLHLYDKGGTNYNKNQKRYMDYNEIPIELQTSAALGWGHVLTAGFFYNNQDTDQDYHDWTTGSFKYNNKYKVQTLAGYLQDVWKVTDDLTMTAGLRYDHWKNYDNVFGNFRDANPEDRTDDHLSPKIGLRYNFDPSTSLWGNFSTGFKPPTSEQLYDDRTSGGNQRRPNPDLDPETTYSYEIGVERWLGKMLQANLIGFYNYTDDKIISWFNASNIWINENIGRSESYGAELALALYLSENWIVSANYTYDEATIEDNPQDPTLEGNYLPFSPRHKVNLGVTYNQPRNFEISAFARYLSKQYSDDANTRRNSAGEDVMMPESFVIDLKGIKHFPVSWGLVKMVDLAVSVDNLFDEEYRTFYIYEDPGTTVFAEIAFQF
jgi:iron complex outermembrane receptor protein